MSDGAGFTLHANLHYTAGIMEFRLIIIQEKFSLSLNPSSQAVGTENL